jgi:hypothetical protein
MCEEAGFPSVSLVSDGFLGQAKVITRALRFSSLPVARLVGHPGAQSEEDLKRNIREVTVAQVVTGLTQGDAGAGDEDAEPAAKSVVFTGGLEDVNAHFLEREWSDGLPIIPPTRERIERFLAHTSRQPDEVVATLQPESRAVTAWSIAVNGVMAGCRPEYMPVLVALVEAMADPEYGLEHSGNTPGADTLIILNGPVIQKLNFNYTQGVMRDGFQPNTSVGRFWRLALRNLAGFLPHKMDKATYGNTWRVVVPENEEVLGKIGWPSVSVDMGFAPTDSTVTISRMTGGNPAVGVTGGTPEEMLPYVAYCLVRQVTWQFGFTVDQGTLRPVLFFSPVLAETIAAAGWSKRRVKEYLFEHARLSAGEVELMRRDWKRHPGWSLVDEVNKGEMPHFFAESGDPNRLVPVVWDPEHFVIAVTGDPLRTNAYVFAHNGRLGFPVTKRIEVG